MIAITAAGLFAAACGSKAPDQGTTPAATGEKTSASVQCMGINSCKGQGSCHSDKNGCKGQNACKGQGVSAAASAEECTSKGGTVQAGN